MIKVAEDHYPQGKHFNQPWEFWVIDDFLPKEIYNELLHIKDNGSYELVDMSNGVHVTERNAIASKHHVRLRRVNAKYKTLYNQLKEECETSLSSLFNFQQFVNWNNETNFVFDLVRCEPKYGYQRHIDHWAKLISIVVYLHPENANGTILIGPDKEEYDVIWKPNRAVIFKTSPEKIHMYKNTTDTYRYSLNVYAVDGNWEFKVRLPVKGLDK